MGAEPARRVQLTLLAHNTTMLSPIQPTELACVVCRRTPMKYHRRRVHLCDRSDHFYQNGRFLYSASFSEWPCFLVDRPREPSGGWEPRQAHSLPVAPLTKSRDNDRLASTLARVANTN